MGDEGARRRRSTVDERTWLLGDGEAGWGKFLDCIGVYKEVDEATWPIGDGDDGVQVVAWSKRERVDRLYKRGVGGLCDGV